MPSVTARPTRRLASLLLLVACATPPPPPPTPVAAAPAATAPADDVVEPSSERLSTAPPPARRRRQFVVTEAEHLKLRKAYPRGFQPDDCVAVCKQDAARSLSDDGEWQWTLRCLLDRNMRDEPIISCREEARAAREKSDEPAKASTYTVIDE